MRTKIGLILKGEMFCIGNAKVPVRTENKFLHLLTTQDLSLDQTVIQHLYQAVDPDGMKVQNGPYEIIKILLAHGCPITTSPSYPIWFFTKEFLRITFYIQTSENKIHLGNFYRTQDQDADEQFLSFAQTAEYPPGFMKYLIDLTLKDGGVVIASEPNKNTILAEAGLTSGTVFGCEETIKMLGYQFMRAA